MKYKTEKVRISSDGEEMKMLILIPSDPARGSNRPGVLWIHGGGYITGMSGMVYMSRAKTLLKNTAQLSFLRNTALREKHLILPL